MGTKQSNKKYYSSNFVRRYCNTAKEITLYGYHVQICRALSQETGEANLCTFNTPSSMLYCKKKIKAVNFAYREKGFIASETNLDFLGKILLDGHQEDSSRVKDLVFTVDCVM